MGDKKFQFSDGSDWDDVPALSQPDRPPPISINDLLIKAQLVTEEVLESSLALAMKMHLPLGRIFAMNGYLSEEMLSIALEVQGLIREDRLTIEGGVKVLELIKHQGITLEEALTRITALPSIGGVHACPIGDLLRESAAINNTQIEDAIMKSIDATIPVGQVLVNTDLISLQLLKSALFGLKIVNRKLATRVHVLQALRAARLRKVPILQPLHEIGALEKEIELEDDVAVLLRSAQVLSEFEYLSALEVHVTEEKTMDEALIFCGLASEESLAATREIVNMMNEGALDKEQAIRLLAKLRDLDWDIQKVMETIDDEDESLEGGSMEAADLLKETGIVHPEDMEIAVKKSLQARQPLTAVLVESGFITSTTFEAARGLVSMLEQNLLKPEQAKIALSYCHENEANLIETLGRFHWMPVYAS